MVHTESILVRNRRYKNIRVFGLETLVEPFKIAVTTYAQVRTSISELIGVEYTKQWMMYLGANMISYKGLESLGTILNDFNVAYFTRSHRGRFLYM